MKERSIHLPEPYELTIDKVVQEKLKLLELQDGDVVMDLGCGDARALIAATKIANVQCIGYEILPEALEASKKNIADAKLEDCIEIIEKDFLEADVSKADALILYLTRFSLGKLSVKLENELPKGTRIVTHDFDIPAWKADKEIIVRSKHAIPFKLFLYHV